MKRLAIAILAVAFAAVGTNASAICTTTQNTYCSPGGVGPTCWMQSGSWCYRDATGCKENCSSGKWQDCEPDTYTCIDYQW